MPKDSNKTLEQAAERALERVKKMSKKELLGTFVDAGILTEKGNVRKPYKGVFVKAS